MRRRAGAVALVSLLLLGCAPSPGGLDRDRPRQRDRASGEASQPPGGPPEVRGVRAQARGPISDGWRVSRVVDGDTVDVTRGPRTLTLRLIGIDTPETVHPTEPIACWGPEATDFASARLLGEPVVLEFDRSQGRLDYYGRTLAYVWTVRGKDSLFNRDAVRRGYALEYTYDTAYAWQRELVAAETAARAERLGVWRCPRPGD